MLWQRHVDDIDAVFEPTPAWEFEMTQLQRGPLGYRSATLDLPGLTLTWEALDASIRSIQHWQERGLFVGFLLQADGPYLWYGQEVTPFAPLVFGAQAQDGILPPNCRVLTLSVPAPYADALGVADLPAGLWHADPARVRAFTDQCHLAYQQTHMVPEHSPENLANHLTGLLLDLLDHPIDLPPSRQYCVMRKAEAFIANTGLDEDMCIDQVARAIGVSRRTMHRAFKDMYDMGPKGYLRLVRLHRFRQSLLAGNTPCVTDAALEAGFDHFGRAAQYYKAQFGELPRDTLLRAG